ncbi:DUF3320 domain-containing protein [Pseudoduganella umbonata]|uniref:DUF3320 domain-containing protein n=1 Tax=Pseudoduganella umbonata TaxID=864828 RepID=A0A4P8HP50_9BURK|nr:DUF3320 domain-containing protein [Pseudoduganella umbonata]MBB3220134.1 very-short-patch-repair endonuclease [Pseudoduganella umbonata]QCP10125.1 DUF3320 domain-containing protein [Pseudoduganella umbonata]
MTPDQPAAADLPNQPDSPHLPDLPIPPDLPVAPLSVTFTADATTGYAAMQNDVPVVRSIALANAGTAALTNVEVSIACQPAFAAGLTLRFERLAAGETRTIAPVDLKPDHAWLAGLDEAQRANVVLTASADGHAPCEAQQGVEVLAYDQWAGTRLLPELLAAFCMPNSRVVDHLVAAGATLLRGAPGSPSMNGYQSRNREKVWQQVSALYGAVLAQDLHYANPPASFGTDGQKIRTPERIVDTKVATCLDLAMLFAACLEQAGLHPVVLLTEAHAWVGVWLIDTCFPTALVDDAQAVRKRVRSGELMVFETTGVTGGQRQPLRLACAAGEEHLADEGAFACAVDIRRARELHIRPLPSHAPAGAAEPEVEQDAPAIEPMPPLPPLDPALLPAADGTADTPEGRLARWKGRLLDLTLRNRLLNFKPSKTTLRVICPDPAALEDTLADGRDFRLRAAPPVASGTDPREASVMAARIGQAPLDALAADALGRSEILVDVPEEALDGRLLDIYRAAGTSLEEGGANTLFLVFGLLEWREQQEAEAAHLAPILLVPVTLTRQSVRSGFRLVRHDDEALVNPTLVQKLAQDFQLKLPAFDVLPADDKGIDVAGILQSFRLHVAELKGWEVREQVHLGIFSFTKYLMWKDLQDRHRQLQENPVVAQLVEHPGEAFAPAALGFEPRTLDASHRPDELFAPLLSDSSQLRAICVAGSGTSLVIEGPPGTGKSQTITNLIAHLLATGKSVLFVSEKMAALEVVQRRLAAIGLGPFSLELHSSKAKKADVVRQLGIALDAAGTRGVREWELEATRLATLRAELNGLAVALHRLHPNDLTVFDAIGTCIAHAGERPAPFAWPDPDAHTRTELEAWRETSRQIGALASQLTTPAGDGLASQGLASQGLAGRGLAGHALSRIGTAAWSPSWEQELLDSAAALATRLAALGSASAAPLQLLGATPDGLSLADLAALDRLAETLLQAPRVPAGVARTAHDEAARARLAALREHGQARNRAWALLAGRHADAIAQLSAADLRREWTAAQTAWWPKSWFASRSLLKRLQTYRTDAQQPVAADVPPLLDALAQVNHEDAAIAAMAADAGALLQGDFAAHRTDWEAVARAERWARDFADAVVRLAGGDIALVAALRASLQPYVAEHRALLAADAPAGAALAAYRDAWRDFSTQLRNTSNLGGCGDNLGIDTAASGALASIAAILQGWQQHARQLRPWCLWQGARARAVNGGLQGVVAALEAGTVALERVPDFFEYSYRNWWVRKVIDREPVLCGFSSADHERKIREFRQADERFQQLTQQYVVASLAARVPATAASAAAAALASGSDSELGRLRRELQKQRRHMPVRQLIAGLPTLLPRLKPCLLMSPLSVAQYLDAGHAPFDVVIFDEASQIPVWDAVGAIARGRQLVCVGDPKQLPPTSFFSRADDGDGSDTDAEVQDLESILDECLGIGLPELTLNWHYRSRHESLIAFSNATYYGNELVTFPSPVTADTAVRFQHVPGVYDRGGTKTNRAEAEAIVAAIERHYLDPARSRHTLGVVTFNSAQQHLIERLLEERRRAHPALDGAIAQPAQEALFIKNLENVQGDERDIILFSVTYGPDAQGKVSLNFGPLNLEGGQRRLNVAISRARQAVVIFSTLLPEQIDLARVRAAGVRDLRNYLEFAIRGPAALAARPAIAGAGAGAVAVTSAAAGGFERQVAAALRAHGWTVHQQVGVSGYRVDLGVVDPRAPGRYLLGIECDGPSYHSGATARDRDRLRQHVLESLGWNLARAWSTDWWLDPDPPLQGLLARLDALLRQEQAPPAGPSTPEPAPAPASEAVPESPMEGSIEAAGEAPAVPQASSPAAALYLPVTLPQGDPERFYEPATAAELRHQLHRIVHEEGPVAQAALFRRIIRAWGLARTGARIEKHLAALLPAQVRTTADDSLFYWPEHLDPATWDGFRVPGAEPEGKRAIDEICLEELGNIALYVLGQQGSTTRAGLARAVCRLLGMARTGAEAEARLGRALAHGRVAGQVAVEDGVVSLLPS